MRIVELQPVKDTPEDYDEIEEAIANYFKKEIYLPLLKILGESSKTLKNSIDDLIEAIQSGDITFHHGLFTGKFSATTSRELKKLGAKWSKSKSGWRLQSAQLPVSITNAIVASKARMEEKLRKIDRKLSEEIPELKLTDLFDTTLWKINKKFEKSIDNITLTPKLTTEMRKKIASEYSENMNLYIKEWTEDEIIKLRKKMKQNVFNGVRYEEMVDTIQKSYGVSQRKAKFLARQETLLLTGTFKQERYADAGIHEYKWRCVPGTPNHPTRPRHKALNDASLKGKIFRFDDPPIVSEPGQPERRANAGMDYNCRCTSVPIVKFTK